MKILININKTKTKTSKSILYFGLFMFTIFISLLINNGYEKNNIDFFSAIKGLFSYLAWPLIYLLAATEEFSEADSIRFNKLLWFIGYVCAANNLIPVVAYFLTGISIGEFIVQDGGIRSFGFLSDQIGFALVYFIIYSLFEKKYLSSILFLSAIIVTGTRGAILVALIALIFSYIYQNKESFSHNNFFFIIKRSFLIIFFLTITWISFGDKISNTILLRLDNNSIEDVSLQRVSAMKSGFELFLENPILGVGIGRFSELVYNSSELSKNFAYFETLTKQENMRGYSNAQNEFINILVNGGLFSMIAVVLFISSVIKNIRIKIQRKDNPFREKIDFMFIILSILFIQTAVYLFNPGVISLIMLTILGRGSSKFTY